MQTREAIIDGYVRARRADRHHTASDGRAGQENRGTWQEVEPMVQKYTPVRSGAVAMDARPNRDVNNPTRGGVRRRRPSETFDTVLNIACLAAWGGLLAIPLVVLYRAIVLLAG